MNNILVVLKVRETQISISPKELETGGQTNNISPYSIIIATDTYNNLT